MPPDVPYRQFNGTAAENYERYFVPAIAAPVAGDLLAAAALQPGERVLDAACGTGVVARFAAERVGSMGTVVGVDLSPDMIAVARSTHAASQHAIDWRCGDAASLPLPDRSIDVVLCQMGLMFMDDKVAALSEMRRVLAATGRIAVNTPGRIHRLFEILADALARHISADLAGFVRLVFSMDDPGAVMQLLQKAEFRYAESRTTVITLRLPPPVDFLWQYINVTPMGAIVGRADEGAKRALEHEIVDRWQEFVENGSLVLPQPMVVATGRA